MLIIDREYRKWDHWIWEVCTLGAVELINRVRESCVKRDVSP